MTAQPLLCRFRRGAWWLAALLLAAGCSGPYTRQQAVPPQYRLTVPEGIRVAAQAMQGVLRAGHGHQAQAHERGAEKAGRNARCDRQVRLAGKQGFRRATDH